MAREKLKMQSTLKHRDRNEEIQHRGEWGNMSHFLHLMILLQNESVFVSNNSYYIYLRLLCTHGN